MYNPYSLENKTILITGASSGIGKATAIECSKLGATLLLAGRNEERLKDTLDKLEGCGHKAILGNLTDSSTMEAIVSSVDFVDGIVLCAGKGLTAPFKFCTQEKYEDIFSTNFFSPVELLRLFVKKKKLMSGSSVVFVGSIAGIANYKVGGSIYGASKAALTATMKYCAHELASKRIRVNSVHPAMVETPIIAAAKMTEEEYKVDMEKYPLKRYGQPEDVAYSIIYLLSNASSWVTGHAMIIDGGRTLL